MAPVVDFVALYYKIILVEREILVKEVVSDKVFFTRIYRSRRHIWRELGVQV